MEESLGLGKKSYGTETDTETQSWFRLPIPQPGFGRTQRWSLHSFSEYIVLITNDVFWLYLSTDYGHTKAKSLILEVNFKEFCWEQKIDASIFRPRYHARWQTRPFNPVFFCCSVSHRSKWPKFDSVNYWHAPTALQGCQGDPKIQEISLNMNLIDWSANVEQKMKKLQKFN